MFKAFKFKLKDPPKDILSQWYGSARWVWNTALAHRIKVYKEYNQSSNHAADCKLLTKAKNKYLWLKEPQSQVLQQKLKDLDVAYTGFFKHGRGFPKFKKRGYKDSIRFPQKVKIENQRIWIPKLGWIRTWGDLDRVCGTIKSATISRDSCGDDYISILCEVDNQTKIKNRKRVLGVDLGIKDCAITCDLSIKGTYYRKFNLPIETLERHDTRLRGLQKKLNRQEIGSNSRSKTRHKIAVLHRKITRIRADYWHKLSTRIARTFSVVTLEDLNIKSMTKLRSLARSLHQRGLSSFVSMLAYKVPQNGGVFHKVSTWFPSSKLCSKCKVKNQDLTLDQRSWTCCSCGTTHDRDQNAARNLALISKHIFKTGEFVSTETEYLSI